MENRIKWLLIAFLLIFSCPIRVWGYSPNTTHSALTSAAIELYDLKHKNKLSLDNSEWLKSGNAAEDKGYRWLNHAYDPINNRGWFKNVGNTKIGLTSKKWSNSKPDQIAYGTHTYIPNPSEWLSGITKNINQSENNQTWEKAIYEYIKGNKKEAFYALGHVLHLIQDAYVPAHTRQNPHVGFIPGFESTYEDWASKFTSDNLNNYIATAPSTGLNIIQSDTLDKYFDLSAAYSNKYFYSEDTIQSAEYNYPQPQYDRVEGKYLLGEDENKNLFKLAKRTNLVFRVISGPSAYTINDPLIFEDYWKRLSSKAISASAGVIELFFKEAEKYKNDKNFLSRNSQSLFADLGKVITGWLGGLINNKQDYLVVSNTELTTNSTTKPVIEVKTAQKTTTKTTTSSSNTENTNSVKPKTTSQTPSAKPKTEIPQTKEASKPKVEEPQPVKTEQPKTVVSFCNFNASNYPARNQVLVSEIAWMGTTNSSSDEWIELKNLTNSPIDISGWQLLSQEENIRIVFPDNANIPANGFYLLERTDDNSVPYITADFIYTGSLNNTGDGLKLFDKNCQLMDEVLANSDWPGGDNSKKFTLERDNDGFGWHTGSVTNGTPKAINSLAYVPVAPYVPPYIPPANNDSNNDQNDNTNDQDDNTPDDNNDQNQTPVYCNSTSTSPIQAPVIINEIAWMGSLNSANDEWVELKNLSNEPVDIKNWQLLDKSEQIKIVFNTDNTVIPANYFYLLERTNDDSVPGIAADLIYTGALSNTDESLRLYNSNCDLIDQALADQGDDKNWSAGDNETKRTMERSSDLTWHTYSGEITNNILGTPKTENSLPATDDTNQDEEDNEPTPVYESYVKNFKWYRTSDGSDKVFLEFDTDGYPFIPSLPEWDNFWSAMVFYLNGDVPDMAYLTEGWGIVPDPNVKGLYVRYYACHGYTIQSTSLILPVPNDAASTPWCSSFPGAPRSFAFRRENIPIDNHYLIEVDSVASYDDSNLKLSDLTSNDYVTIGFYTFDGFSRPGYQRLMLKDKNKYYLKVDDQ